MLYCLTQYYITDWSFTLFLAGLDNGLEGSKWNLSYKIEIIFLSWCLFQMCCKAAGGIHFPPSSMRVHEDVRLHGSDSAFSFLPTQSWLRVCQQRRACQCSCLNLSAEASQVGNAATKKSKDGNRRVSCLCAALLDFLHSDKCQTFHCADSRGVEMLCSSFYTCAFRTLRHNYRLVSWGDADYWKVLNMKLYIV